jgi:hypothetical protein
MPNQISRDVILEQLAAVKATLEDVLLRANDYDYTIDSQKVEQAKFACMGLGMSIYGNDAPQVKQFLDAKKANADDYFAKKHLAESLIGFVRNVEVEVKGNLIASIVQRAQSEVLADFLLLAKQIEPTKNKDVCAVLASASLEDTLKKIAIKNGLNVEDKDMSDVVNALKAKGKFSGPQGPILSGYVKIRNKAFHAQWDAFESAEVVSLIAFTETLILQELS